MGNQNATYKYKIDYGYGVAVLYTPYDPVERFYTLANTCFGIRKSIMGCQIYGREEKSCPPYNERLEFSGDVYVWDHRGARKMLYPFPDEEWDLDLMDECAPPKTVQLEPCPRCSVPPRIGYACGEYFAQGKDPDCPICGVAFTEMHSSEEEEIKAWNRRATNGQ